MEFVGTILLSFPLILLLLGKTRLEKAQKWIEVNLRHFLEWVLNKNPYKQMRFRETPNNSFFAIIRANYAALFLMLLVAIGGAITTAGALSRYPLWVIIAIPFAVLMGYAVSRLYSNRFMKVFMFVLSVVLSPVLYALLVASVLLHASIVTILMFLTMLWSFVSRQTARNVMLITGGVFFFIGIALEFAETFL